MQGSIKAFFFPSGNLINSWVFETETKYRKKIKNQTILMNSHKTRKTLNEKKLRFSYPPLAVIIKFQDLLLSMQTILCEIQIPCI